MVELAHEGRYGALRTGFAGFYYRLEDTVSGTFPHLVVEALPEIRVRSPFANLEGDTRAWGGELGVEAVVKRGISAFANYSFLRIRGELDGQVSENGGPRHKANAGIRIVSGGLRASLRAHWVGATSWEDADLATLTFQPAPVADYMLVNAHAGYALSGRLKGFEVGVSAFNLTDHAHYQILPAQNNLKPGQGGEVMRRRVTATVSYRH